LRPRITATENEEMFPPSETFGTDELENWRPIGPLATRMHAVVLAVELKVASDMVTQQEDTDALRESKTRSRKSQCDPLFDIEGSE
jgi:hypothetical protein